MKKSSKKRDRDATANDTDTLNDGEYILKPETVAPKIDTSK